MDPEEMQNVEIYFGQNIQCFFTEKFIMKILIHFRSIPSSFPTYPTATRIPIITSNKQNSKG